MARSNKKDPSFVVVRVLDIGHIKHIDRSFKAQHFDARADARDFASSKNRSRRKLDKRYTVLPVFPGPINRTKW
jgi:hypothetical protein